MQFSGRKIKCFLLIFYLSSFYSFSQDTKQKQINWMTWEEAIKTREKFITENKTALDAGQLFPKKIFIDVYTDWCGWCKKMDASTFLDPMVVDYMNDNYYAVKMDAKMKDTIIFNNHTFINPQPDTKRSTHSLPGSLLDWKLSYPSYIILDENFSRIMVIPGYRVPEDLMGWLIFFKNNHHLIYNQYMDNQKQIQQQQKTKN
jgi:thioredoxin-related protein